MSGVMGVAHDRACLRAIGVERQLPIDVVGIRAVRSIWKVTDEKHAAVLALIDELLAIGTPEGTAQRLPRPRLTLQGNATV